MGRCDEYLGEMRVVAGSEDQREGKEVKKKSLIKSPEMGFEIQILRELECVML